jgi:hypothetical protein
MAITVTAAGRIGALDGLLDVIDGGSGDATGDFHLLTSADVALATLPFSNPAFAAAADVSGTVKAAANSITASGTPTPGTIAKGQFRNRANTSVIAFAVGASGSDMNVADVVIPSGATSVTCSGIEVSLALS